MTTRLATLSDAAAIAGIYNQGIEERIATFETEPPFTDRDRASAGREGGSLSDDRGRTW
jgi:L-amino acid N-acyltransferase YncA